MQFEFSRKPKRIPRKIPQTETESQANKENDRGSKEEALVVDEEFFEKGYRKIQEMWTLDLNDLID